MWMASAGCVEILGEPTCVSDYVNTSTCQWKMDRATNCSAELHLSYKLLDPLSPEENRICVPENKASAECVCILQMESLVSADNFELSLLAGSHVLWNSTFKPEEHIKPLAPRHLLVQPITSDTWQLTWSNPYSSNEYLDRELIYMVSVSNQNDPTDVKIYNVTYKDTFLRLAASTLKSEANYSAQVKAQAPSYNSTWSDWSAKVLWQNSYQPAPEQHYQVGVGISCIIILFVCLSCYIGIIRIKEWWDQIPTPARSPLMAVIIQEPQAPLWRKPCQSQEVDRSPRWKTCLSKLLPCFLEHTPKKDEFPIKTAMPSPGMSIWRPVEVKKTVLWPERTSVVQCVELLEAQVQCEEEDKEEEEEEEQEQEDKGSFCPSSGSTTRAFLEGRKDIADRLTESLFLDILGTEDGSCGLLNSRKSGILPPPGSEMSWTRVPGVESQEASFQREAQPFSFGSAALPHSPAHQAITDNPAYRSFQQCLQSEVHASPGQTGEEVLSIPGDSQPSCMQQPESESWEQSLHQSILQHQATPALATAPLNGYRGFMQAVEQGSTENSGVTGSLGQAGYKAFSSLLTQGGSSPGTPGVQDSSGSGGYRPLQSLASSTPTTPVPLLTFGLDLGPPQSSSHSLSPNSSLEHPSPEPGKGRALQDLPELDTEPLRDELASAVVYSALTCHLCGHLKQCHGQEERGKAPIVASGPCCGCCCGDRSTPPESPLPSGGPPDSNLSSALLVSSGCSDQGPFSLTPVAPTCLSMS